MIFQSLGMYAMDRSLSHVADTEISDGMSKYVNTSSTTLSGKAVIGNGACEGAVVAVDSVIAEWL